MNLNVNMLIQWQVGPDERLDPFVERVLWIDPSATDCITIEITEERVLPKLRRCEDIISAISVKEARILESDPYAALHLAEQDISEKQRQRRDTAFELIAPLVTDENYEYMIYRSKRGPLVTEIAKRNERAKSEIYDFLRWYWQAGGIKNALLPAFDKCGGRGKRRVADNTHSPKRGRPKKHSEAMDESVGVNITADIKRRFERGIQKFYETPEKQSLSNAFQLTLETFFNDGFAIVDGVPVPVIPPDDKLPTERQFRYWYNGYRNAEQEKKRRDGERKYNLEGRELLGDSTQMAFGPGSVYQIDATIGDIYLVNSLDRSRIIGRPVIYACIDVFSRAIAGLCVTLEGPSWLGAMLALDNVTMNKVAFCAEYGITIEEVEWPCHYLPEAILADRGEFEGYNADNLANSLGVRVHNTPPYRADWKGIVERHFRIANDKVIHFTPGAVYRVRARGDADYRLQAVLTLDEFRKLMICYARDYNMNHYMKWYRKDEYMIADHVERYPLAIWEWGIRNRSGHLRTMPQDVIRLNLLPRKEVFVTAHGIHFEGELYYSCDLALKEGWFSRARMLGAWKIEVSYDPRRLDMIYVRLNGGRRLEPCHLTAASKTFLGHDWHEAMDYFALERQAETAALTRTRQSSANLHAQQAQIVGEATEKTQAARAVAGRQSKRALTKGIRKNRLEERQAEQEQNAWLLGVESGVGAAISDGQGEQSLVPLVSSKHADEQEYVPPSRYAERLRELREKEWENNEH
jgi:hypothetical protein